MNGGLSHGDHVNQTPFCGFPSFPASDPWPTTYTPGAPTPGFPPGGEHRWVALVQLPTWCFGARFGRCFPIVQRSWGANPPPMKRRKLTGLAGCIQQKHLQCVPKYQQLPLACAQLDNQYICKNTSVYIYIYTYTYTYIYTYLHIFIYTYTSNYMCAHHDVCTSV